MFTNAKTNKPIRLKTTIVIESQSQKDLEDALTTARGLALARVELMSFGSKKKGGAHVSCRTTQMRPAAK